ncbi:MAG: hypothetical protein WBO55_08885 [Rhizobiaceae bacterium]
MKTLADFHTKLRNMDLSEVGLGTPAVTAFVSNGIIVCNALENVEYHEDGFQLIICEHCGIPGCERGSLVGLKKLDDQRAILLPSVKLVRSDSHEYFPPRFMFVDGFPVLSKADYCRVKQLNENLPDWNEIAPITACDCLAMHQMTAPGSILGKLGEKALIDRNSFLAVTEGDLDTEIGALEQLIEEIEAGKQDGFSLQVDRVLEFHLDLEGFPTWTGCGYYAGRAVLVP